MSCEVSNNRSSKSNGWYDSQYDSSSQYRLRPQSRQPFSFSRGKSVQYIQSNQQKQQYASEQAPISNLEQQILNSQNPIPINEIEQIEAGGYRGIYANKNEHVNWNGPIPLNQYQFNSDSNPEVIRKKPVEKVQYQQHVGIKYLSPPTPPKPGDLIIREKVIQASPAPPLIIRSVPQQPTGSPPPLVYREAPPRPPSILESKTVRIPGPVLPPRPRKLIVEKVPAPPEKPAPIIIERW
jgi:hypothetical protein